MSNPVTFSTQDLVQMIGQKQIEIESLQAQLQVLAKGYQEVQAKLLEAEAHECVQPGETAVIQVPAKKGKKS